MTISSQRVEELFKECLSENGRVIQGVIADFSMDVTGHEDEIGEMLEHLPDNFMASKGGGWSFLNACMDREDNQWTGLHYVMEQLFVLGIAAERAKWVLPRDMWEVLPGGMPYVVILEK